MATLLQQGLLIDGTGAPARIASLRIEEGLVTTISDEVIPPKEQDQVVDARGLWITPGFIDIHTHYDAEVEVDPALTESLRHGITTVFTGSCSLSVAVGDPTDLADMFTRVEAIPYQHLLPILQKGKDWDSHEAYAQHLESLPLGINVASFVGYSAIRASVLGLERSLSPSTKPTEEELCQMEARVEEGLEAGYLGLSVNTLYWDKMGGDRFRSRCLPSTYASWRELSRMIRLVRRKGRNLQVIPNISTRYELLVYAMMSAGFGFRKALKTTLVSIMDLKSSRTIWRLLTGLGWFFNTVLRGKFRYQFLPVPFDLWADGFENVVFEEFGAGAAALHLEDPQSRRALLREKGFRAWFRRQWQNPILPRVFHRNLGLAIVRSCPDTSLEGRTFRDISVEEGRSEVETFLDLVAKYGKRLRWYTVVGNDRPSPRAALMRSEQTLIGFSDAGAHLRTMAFYNFHLRMLRFVRNWARRGRPHLSIERAIHRLTGELADWFGLDAGRVEVGARADVVVLDPEGLDHGVEEVHEAPMAAFGGFVRLVRRNPKAVRAVFVGGEQVVSDGSVMPQVGHTVGPGRFLRVGQRCGPRPAFRKRSSSDKPSRAPDHARTEARIEVGVEPQLR